MSRLQYFGMKWLAEAVVLADDKKYWADVIREALREFPKKERQSAAIELCKMLKSEKRSQLFRRAA